MFYLFKFIKKLMNYLTNITQAMKRRTIKCLLHFHFIPSLIDLLLGGPIELLIRRCKCDQLHLSGIWQSPHELSMPTPHLPIHHGMRVDGQDNSFWLRNTFPFSILRHLESHTRQQTSPCIPSAKMASKNNFNTSL